ncbi:cryptochrome/photolyase family protein [Natronohydrobacter thiooxidans]|uniref:cryptochrome/photolyase family protein n=1 Tax=Natronohydrobacter thiooxidans TaxID=87172 RepID=UPI0008FF6DD6|nr:deoxyribodipyrimidine photo-lyase [Natronohydrobacter thiooxidans]
MSDTAPILLWFRRDLRLSDHPAFTAAAASGRPVIPVFLCDQVVEGLGAAPKWRLGLGVEAFAQRLEGIGARLILRRGDALAALQALIAETGATAVWWGRQYDPVQIARDKAVKAALTAQGIEARSFPGHLLFEPWEVATGQGGFYQVYTPFWKAVRGRDVAARLPAPEDLRVPEAWPESDDLANWGLGRAMGRGADVVARYLHLGEEAAQARLAGFMRHGIEGYGRDRDRMDLDATSGLSENLTYGEISPLALWEAGQRALQGGKAGAETFLKELVWREFAYHLIWHTPHITTRNWREGWEGFPWQKDNPDSLRWKQGRTGIALVDAAMREIYVTGRMHNRARMLVGSYLTKHMLTDWRVGLEWFAECLVDWDPAANAMGWQWVAGCGPDASPYFRIFNPDTQAAKFDPESRYRRRWLAELSEAPPESALQFFDACPRKWGMKRDQTYPAPLVDLAEGRKRALEAYHTR